MCGIKSGVMTALALFVVVTASITATLQAQEISSHRSSITTAMPTLCIDIPGRAASCLSSRDNLLGVTHDSLPIHGGLLPSDHLSQVGSASTDPLFTLQDSPCEKWQNTSRSSMATDYPDPISVTRYLTVDFEMDNINRFELSSLSFGFKDCW